MPQTNPRKHVTAEDIKRAATLSLEELTKWMVEHGLFGFSPPRGDEDQKIKELERLAKLSPDCQFEETE
ncbi:MAG: hypothetical protein ACFFB3_04255 [Candidatus Hodarchaeota archaeon]